MKVAYTLRQRLAAALIDWPRYEWGLRAGWTHIRNRDERLCDAPEGLGVACEWLWTSDLHAAKVFPSLGRRLLRRCLEEWAIVFGAPTESDVAPQVSFVIGHRGAERIPHLLATIASIGGQRGAAVECIVVEQSSDSLARSVLPGWVRHLHTPCSDDSAYSRAWALNCGVRQARGEIVVLHDGDLLVPAAYADEIRRRAAAGYDVVDLKRFLFYLDAAQSREVFGRCTVPPYALPEAVTQNLQGGGSIAVRREAYHAIGGHDESFRGWGGEDNEFWERASTLRLWPYGYLPLVHLWHPSQPRKAERDNPNIARYAALSSVPAADRIARLSRRAFGDPRAITGEES